MLTSDELEWLGDHLLAAVVSVLVVRHDCGCSGACSMLVWRQWLVVPGRDEVKLAMG